MQPTRPDFPPQPAAQPGGRNGPYAQPPYPTAPPPAGPPPAWHPASPAWRESRPQPAEAARLRCPKCRGDLVTYERQEVHLEQCFDCRGIWLDRGELDRLIDAEAKVQEASTYPAPAYQAPRERRGEDDRDRREWWGDDDPDQRDRSWDDDDDDRSRRRRSHDDDRGQPGRRRSMFSDLFEGLIE
jgi:uncharacterized protein